MQQCFGVDIGNSGIRIAELRVPQRELGEMLRINWCPQDTNAIRRCSESTQRYLPSDPAWLEELAEFLPSDRPTHWLISSVRRDAYELLDAYIRRRKHDRLQRVTHASIPLAIHVDYPSRVGIDRLLAALAATEMVTVVQKLQPAIVVQAGSAVTVDLVVVSLSKDAPQLRLGTFEGGAIVPGVPMMLRLLGHGAEMLPQIDADDLLQLPDLPGKNTEDAMICGTASALVGGVTHLIQRYRAQYDQDVPVILSGGDGMRLSPYIDQPVCTKPHLVHQGLLKLAELALAGQE